ncbi:MAG TPA: PilZ domain-containing protein [Thermoanaerobaculia bacterium]
MTSALLSIPEVSQLERRRSPRHRLSEIVPVQIGHGNGTLIDISATGIRVRHESPVALRSIKRVSFQWHGTHFAASAEVLASRVVSLARGRYESRLHFLALSTQAQQSLERIIADLEENNMRRWVANLRGWNEKPSAYLSTPAQESFVRCLRRNGRWEQKITHSSALPEDGFTIPAETAPSEVLLLCRTYEQSEDGREMVRLVSRAVVTQHAPRKGVK